MNKPNVIAKIQYIECDNPRRVFYSSGSKDDYLGYIDKGVKLNKDIDYLDYTGNLEKSSGVFNQNGLLNYDSKRLIREALRNTKSCIWDLVVSFETEYGLKNVDSYEDALELVKSVLPKFFKALKLKEDNIICKNQGTGYPLQYPGLENSMDCIVHAVAKSQTQLSNFQFTVFRFCQFLSNQSF